MIFVEDKMSSLINIFKAAVFSFILLMVSCDSMSELKKYTVSHIPYKGVPRIATTNTINKSSAQNLSYHPLTKISEELKKSVKRYIHLKIKRQSPLKTFLFQKIESELPL
jgi:hypothetical protein